MEQENKSLQIPFVKPARVGNYKLWRSRVIPNHVTIQRKDSVNSGKKKSSSSKVAIDVINISNLDGLWKVQIPQTMMMFSTLAQGFAVEDNTQREQFLGSIIGNIYNISTNSNVYLHDALAFLTEMMVYPYMLLPEKEMKERMEKGLKEFGWDKVKRKEHIGKMVEYRKQLYDLIEKKKSAYIEDYERQQAERRAKEEESLKALEQDEIAEQAIQVLNENEESNEENSK